MDTTRKLEEAEYFLGTLIKTKDTPEVFQFYLSAFLSAWRSVLDIMLYDFAEYYSLGFTRENFLDDRCFKAVAAALANEDALRCIEWWRRKQGRLQQNTLWRKRSINVHRGYPTVIATTFYLSGSGGTSMTFTPPPDVIGNVDVSEDAIPTTTAESETREEVRFSDFPDNDVVGMCTQALNVMKEIVAEAERLFGIEL